MRRLLSPFIVALTACLLFCPQTCHAKFWPSWASRTPSISSSGTPSTQGSSKSGGGGGWKFWKSSSNNRDTSSPDISANHEFFFISKPRPNTASTGRVSAPNVKVRNGYATPLDSINKIQSSPSPFNNLNDRLGHSSRSRPKISPSKDASLPVKLGPQVTRYPPPKTAPPPPPEQSGQKPRSRQKQRMQRVEHIYNEPITPRRQQKSEYAKPLKGKVRYSFKDFTSSSGYESLKKISLRPSGSGQNGRKGQLIRRPSSGGKLSKEEIDRLYAKPDLAAKKSRRLGNP
ncbi:hypothetical protein XA68_12333 [Ophiocordyceps unilateralis]|uniref:Uncharacterized protein n=1 Tax=Ophiocordyceps unilateralis TaxID=268505 RepID=A0A2A9PQ48_OPHUN|nr:hypothetical protein XA68_12333 [Ophiocordyceps unilateralis]